MYPFFKPAENTPENTLKSAEVIKESRVLIIAVTKRCDQMLLAIAKFRQSNPDEQACEKFKTGIIKTCQAFNKSLTAITAFMNTLKKAVGKNNFKHPRQIQENVPLFAENAETPNLENEITLFLKELNNIDEIFEVLLLEHEENQQVTISAA